MVTVSSPDPLPDGLLDAFWRYDAALLSNDRETLDALFAPGPDTLRGDGTTLLLGHEAIAGFRSGRAKIPTRRVVELQVRTVGEDAALVLAATRDGAARGLQTQLWRRFNGQWLVTAAHVGMPAPAAAFDRTIWRTLGDPLVPAAESGPLDGLGIAVKDLFAVAGERIGAGVPAWLAEQAPEAESAPAVSALLGAGAHVVGMARTDEFAYSLAGTNVHYGTPPNPAAPGGISGGSSSGPASAVALRHVPIGLGTDTGGSVRVPASYQGLVGLRTSHGAIPTTGVLPLAPSFDTVGWLTRDVATSAAVAAVLLPDSTLTARRTLRLPTVEALARPDVRSEFGATVDRFTSDGKLPVCEEIVLPAERLERWFTAFRTVQGWEAWQAHGSWITAHPGALGADVAGRFAQAAGISSQDVLAARDVVIEARQELTRWLADSVLAIPTASGPALARTATASEIETARGATVRMTCLAGLCGAPAVSLPLLRGTDGPAGLCLITAPGTDRGLLRLAERSDR
jgi:Asp-tRNA(Asn)/Glu-tRNA(Gln) amidotransferase A subunit family amidase